MIFNKKHGLIIKMNDEINKMIHDLNNILTPIAGLPDLILKDIDSVVDVEAKERIIDNANTIKNCSKKMVALIIKLRSEVNEVNEVNDNDKGV